MSQSQNAIGKKETYYHPFILELHDTCKKVLLTSKVTSPIHNFGPNTPFGAFYSNDLKTVSFFKCNAYLVNLILETRFADK